jgi:hypothetical protein
MAERVGFVPVVLPPVNNLGLIRISQTAKSTQNLSIRYKTGTAESVVEPAAPCTRSMDILYSCGIPVKRL